MIHDKYKNKDGETDHESLIGLTEEGKENNPDFPVDDIRQYPSNMVDNSNISKGNKTEIVAYQESAAKALSLVDDVVLKKYLVQLSKMDLVEMPELSAEGTILFKINKMVYEKDEYAVDKFVSTVSAMTFTRSSVFLLVDGHNDHTDFYLGVKCEDDDRTANSVAEAFCNAVRGQFPGIQMEDISCIEKGATVAKQEKIFARLKAAKSISSCVGIPSLKVQGQERTNSGFVQGIEKLALAMRGKEYTAIILAQNSTSDEIQSLRHGYENLYTQLSTQATQQLTYSANESLANALSRTKGYSDCETHGTSHTVSQSDAHTEGETHSKGTSNGTSRNNFWGKAGKAATPLLEAGAILTATGVGAPVGAIMMAAGGIAGVGNMIGASTKNNSENESNGTNISDSHTDTTSNTENESRSHQENFSETNGRTATIGSSKNFTLTVHNKHIEELLKRIDKQLQRIDHAESTGLWQTGAYFLSYENDRASAEIAATIFRSIIQGENSGIEASAINTWYIDSDANNNSRLLPAAISSFTHPVFSYKDNAVGADIQVTGTSLINSAELAMMIGLPRKSVPGLPVVEHATLAKEVVSYTENDHAGIKLGCIFDYGIEYPQNMVSLKKKSLTQHVFVTGSTGCGKSETVYKLIDEARSIGAKFLIVEPAKGEYKKVFGDVAVYGTNPKITNLLRINPFRFPSGDNGIHVLEHIDRLVEIFNVCWPMYAAMPAVLKKAVLSSYERCGWNLAESTNKIGLDIYPTFEDLLQELSRVINESAYSEEVKSNYTGSLVTRVESLTNGLNGEIFTSNDLSDADLFDKNVIVDLSRVGSTETKSLIMGFLVLKLTEYRVSSQAEPNSNLCHLSVLEEAHNILKRISMEQSMEGSNVAGKSVEMLTNAIAEMRTYGEGFVIVDQSPTSVAPAAIKNTNTKIIMRLPDSDDRLLSGKSAGMKLEQIDEIAKLPTGVAVVYQNDWVAPVLCKIDKYSKERVNYSIAKETKRFDNSKAVCTETLKMLLKGRVKEYVEPDIDFIFKNIIQYRIPTSLKMEIAKVAEEVRKGNTSIWADENFIELSNIVTDFLSARPMVEKAVKEAQNFKELNDSLDRFIEQKASISENTLLAVRQCLMRQYGEKNDTSKSIYNAWFNEIKKELLS